MMNIRTSDVMFAAACCLESAAGTIEDLVKPNSGLYDSTKKYRIVAKHLREEIAKAGR